MFYSIHRDSISSARIHSIEEGDASALGAVVVGAVGGAGVSAAVGGIGLAVGGTAVGIGMAPVAAAGAVVGLAAYGVAKLIDNAGTGETSGDNGQFTCFWA